jgi:hypothetical protein
MKHINYKREFIIRSIKIFNIGWAAVAYFVIAIACLFTLEKIYGKFDEKKYEKMTTIELIIEVILYLWLIGILTYIVRNFFVEIPFPFDGFMGYQHNRVKEVVNATVFSIFIVSLNPRIQGYYTLLKNRLTTYVN